MKKFMHLGFLFILVFHFKSAHALQETYFKETVNDVPYREQAVIISKDGFFPNRIVVYKGEKVRFFVTSVGVDSACFNIPDKNVFASPGKDKIAESEVFFDKVGVFAFNCPNNTFNGRVMVLEKAADREETQRRGLASDLVKIWKPKDTPTEWVQIKRSELKEDYIDLDEHTDRDRIQQDESPRSQPSNGSRREVIGFGGRDLATED